MTLCSSTSYVRPRQPELGAPRRRGFTILELLVVIAVLGVLIGIAIVAFRGLDPRGKATSAILHNAASLLAEFQANGGNVQSLPGGTSLATNRASIGSDGGQRDQAIDDTRQVMQQLLRIPQNKNAMSKFPTEGLLKSNDPATPVPADAWGNPLVFVPASGLAGVDLSDNPNQTVRSPDGRAFFASAGPDGQLTKGDDNRYSFRD